MTTRLAVYDARGLALKKGMRVAFDIEKDTSGSLTLTTIWILSKKGYKR